MSHNQRRRRFRIPSHILNEIARYLHPDVTEEGQAALASLTLVSRRVHEAVDRELYAAPRLTSIMQWVLFLEALRRTGESDIERRVRRLCLTGPTSGFRYRFTTRDAVFVPIAIDILKAAPMPSSLLSHTTLVLCQLSTRPGILTTSVASALLGQPFSATHFSGRKLLQTYSLIRPLFLQ